MLRFDRGRFFDYEKRQFRICQIYQTIYNIDEYSQALVSFKQIIV